MMKKIGIIFMLFGFFFPMVLGLFTEFTDARRYRGVPAPVGLIEYIQSGSLKVITIGSMNYWTPYPCALAFSIVVFAVGIGFLLLSKQTERR